MKDYKHVANPRCHYHQVPSQIYEESERGFTLKNDSDKIFVTVKHKCYKIIVILKVQLCYRK